MSVDDGWEDARTKVARWRAVKARINAAFPLPRNETERAIRDAWELGQAEGWVEAMGLPAETVYDVPGELLALDPERS